MQEKKQKKIKASGMPAKLAGYIIGEVGICATYQANFPASAEAAGQVAGYILEAAEASGQVCRVHY